MCKEKLRCMYIHVHTSRWKDSQERWRSGLYPMPKEILRFMHKLVGEKNKAKRSGKLRRQAGACAEDDKYIRRQGSST